jgi:tetratricopeptide (TPR) repeat protein
LLVSHAIPIALTVVAADRFLYLPTIGLAVIAVQIDCWAWRHAWWVLVSGVLSLVPPVIVRSAQWADPILLWSDACRTVSSRSSLALMELGNLESENGNHERALTVFSTVLRSRDRDKAADRLATNRAILLGRLGRHRAARAAMVEVVLAYPRVPKFRYDLAVAQLHDGQFVAADESLAEALRLMPNYRDAADVRASLSQFERAYRELESSKLSAVERAMLHNRLGLHYEAEADWTTVLGSSLVDALWEQVVVFAVEHGSTTFVERVLNESRSRSHLRGDLLEMLQAKYQAAERLRRIPLEAYGMSTPGS